MKRNMTGPYCPPATSFLKLAKGGLEKEPLHLEPIWLVGHGPNMSILPHPPAVPPDFRKDTKVLLTYEDLIRLGKS